MSPRIHKKFVGPALDVPINVNLPDLSDVETADVWMQQYVLSSTFQGEYTGATKLYAESLIARVQILFAGYRTARLKTAAYSDGWSIGQPGVGRYLAAVGEWEAVVLNIQIIMDLMATMFGMKYSPGGPEDRIRLIANRIKHVSDDISNAKLDGPGLPLWLTPSGISCTTVSVSFDELVHEVKFLAKVAGCLSMPSAAAEKFAALRAEYAADFTYKPKA